MDWICESQPSEDVFGVLEELLKVNEDKKVKNHWLDIIHKSLIFNRGKGVKNTILADKLYFIICKWMPHDLLTRVWKANISLFTMLWFCRSGVVNDKLLATMINSALGTTGIDFGNIFNVISTVQPFYWLRERPYHIGDIDVMSGETMSNLDIDITAVPTLAIQCIAAVRNVLRLNNNNDSLYCKIQSLNDYIPQPILRCLQLNSHFGRDWMSEYFEETCDFLQGRLEDIRMDGEKKEVESTKDSNGEFEDTLFSCKCKIMLYTSVCPAFRHLNEHFKNKHVPLRLMLILSHLSGRCLESAKQPEEKYYPPKYDSLYKHITSLSNVIDMSNTDTGMPALVDTIVTELLENVFSSRGIKWTSKRYGSTSLGLKILQWDEFDYSIQLDTSTCSKCTIVDRSFLVVNCISENSVFMDPKNFLHNGINEVLSGLRKPDKPQSGVVYLDKVYCHSNGPGVCMILGWSCPRGHQHTISIDLVPAIVLKDKTLGNVWAPPPWFDAEPFVKVKEVLQNMHPVFVPHYQMPTEGNGALQSRWKLSFKFCDKFVLQAANERTDRCVKHTLRFLKLMRNILFPKIMKRNIRMEDDVYTCNLSELVSSHVVAQVMFRELINHPQPYKWTGEHFLPRLMSILNALLLDNVECLYTRGMLHILPIAPAYRSIVQRCMSRVMAVITNNIGCGCMKEHGCPADNTFEFGTDSDMAFMILKSDGCALCQLTVTDILLRPSWSSLYFDYLENLCLYRWPEIPGYVWNYPFISIVCHNLARLLMEEVVDTDDIPLHFSTYELARDQDCKLILDE